MPTNSQIPLPPTMQRCRWRWFWSHLHVVVTIKPIPPNNTNIKTPFFKQPNLNIWFHKEVLSNFKRRLGSLSSLEDFLSINAFLKVILMKKLWFFLKSCQLGFVFGVHGMSNQFIGKPNSFDITNGHTMKVLKGQEKQENPFIKRRVLIASKWSSSSPLLHCFCCYKPNHSVHERSQKFVKIVGWAPSPNVKATTTTQRRSGEVCDRRKRSWRGRWDFILGTLFHICEIRGGNSYSCSCVKFISCPLMRIRLYGSTLSQHVY